LLVHAISERDLGDQERLASVAVSTSARVLSFRAGKSGSVAYAYSVEA
jgi:hypothetical protein